jgi:hypothetical protein
LGKTARAKNSHPLRAKNSPAPAVGQLFHVSVDESTQRNWIDLAQDA